jgi:hypothetical protein
LLSTGLPMALHKIRMCSPGASPCTTQQQASQLMW